MKEVAAFNATSDAKGITVDKIEVKNGHVELVMTYSSAGQYSEFNGNILFYGTVQEAVDAGWADEVITSEGAAPVAKLTPDKSRLMVNGHAVAACLFGKLPDGIPEMTAEEFAALSTPEGGEEPHNNSGTPAPQARNNTPEDGGKKMEIKTPEELRSAFPDLVAQVETAARAEGATAERNRIQEIESVQAAIGDTKMVADAKYGEKPMNAQELAFKAMQAHAAAGTAMVTKMTDDTKNSGTANVSATPATQETKKMTDDEQAEALLVNAIKNKKEDK